MFVQHFLEDKSIGSNILRKKFTGMTFCQREKYWCEILSQRKLSVLTFVREKDIGVKFCHREKYLC